MQRVGSDKEIKKEKNVWRIVWKEDKARDKDIKGQAGKGMEE